MVIARKMLSGLNYLTKKGFSKQRNTFIIMTTYVCELFINSGMEDKNVEKWINRLF